MSAEGNKIIGFVSSTWDLLHAGHVAMVREALRHCDYLVAGLLVDPTKDRAEFKNPPIQSVFERYLQVKALRGVEEVIPFESERDLRDLLLTLSPNVRIIGEEYRGKKFTGYDIEGIEVIFNPRGHSFSSTELRGRVCRAGVDESKPSYSNSLPKS